MLGGGIWGAAESKNCSRMVNLEGARESDLGGFVLGGGMGEEDLC